MEKVQKVEVKLGDVVEIRDLREEERKEDRAKEPPLRGTILDIKKEGGHHKLYLHTGYVIII